MGQGGIGSIYIGLGANLPHPTYGAPIDTLKAALADLGAHGIEIRGLSPWYRSAPVPISDQPWYVNAAAEIATGLPPDPLLAVLHEVEEAFGRVRSEPNAARRIDLDLLDFCGEIASGGSGKATLPHPRMAARAFVMRPLADLAPAWRHPVTGAAIAALVAALPAGQIIEKL